MIKNLGQVAAIYVGKTAPRNVNMIWLDNTVIPYVFKSYNGEEWTEIPTGTWVETYVNGWLVSLQQGTVTTDDDYVLVNSGGVNYKMTVKDFVKSSVGNPLDFKGVIRTDADFPNPSTLESGDMYIIITNPTGGTVTDPYSGKTFSDSEKIVWDSVINSWASLGKIDVKVDLSTTYSATEVTIHSSAGKETTVVGVTDDNAGVMVPVQKKWLDALSDGSTLTPQGPSTAPYHKHRYSDIVDRIISQQVTGDSAINPMSQKATTEALNLKLDKSAVLQVSGVSTTDVMSQKAVTDAIQTLKSNVDDKLSCYLPLSGGTMTGTLRLSNNISLASFLTNNTSINLAKVSENNIVMLSTSETTTRIYSNASDLTHFRGVTGYPIHDTYNLPDPAKLSANQTFIGENNFTAGKFNVTEDKFKFSVNNVGGLRMYYDYGDDELGISRYLDFYTKKSSDTNYTRRGIFGLYASKSTPNSDWAYIGIGDVGSKTAQYKFSPNTLYVPETFYLRTLQSKIQLIGIDNINNRARFGGPLIPTWILSNNTDLFHSKYTNSNTHAEYKIWDESNLPNPASSTDLANYLPLSGGNMSGNIVLGNGVLIQGKDKDGVPRVLTGVASGSNIIYFGNVNSPVAISTIASDITHVRGSDNYKIYDSYNLPNPVQTSDLDSYLTKTEASTTYYPIGGRGFLSFDASGRPIMNNNQGYSVRDKDSTAREVLWMDAVNNLSLGNTSSWTLPSITFRAANVYWGNSLLATQSWVTNKNYLTSSSLDGYAKTTDLASYLPLAGGTMTGAINFSSSQILTLENKPLVAYDSTSNYVNIGGYSLNSRLFFLTSQTDLQHYRKNDGELAGTPYKIWDAYNVSSPLDYMKGTAGQVASVSGKEISINGVNQTHIVLGLGGNGITLFAPTTAGTSGQVLQSQGAGKAPIWVDGGTGGGVQLSDTNVWTGLNTFQGGLKTSDGTNSYDVWDKNNLKYVARITPSNLGYALSFYTTTAGWRDFDDLCINNLMPNASKTIEQGGAGFVGQYESAYASAEIKDIITQNIFASGGKNLSNVSTGASFLGNESNAFKSAYIGEINTNTVKSADGKSLLNFKTDGVYMIANSGTEYKLATLNDVSGGGSSVSLDGNNTWTGVNIFSGTGLVTNQYDSGNTEIPATANYSIRLACSGSYNNYGFGAVRSEDRVKQSYAFVQTPSAFFTFDNSGSLYTTIGNTKYEFWNKQNLAKPIIYNTNSDGDGILYKGDSTSNRLNSLELVGILPPTNNAVSLSNGGTGGFGNINNAYAEAYIGAVHANNVTTTTIVVPGSENYFEFKEDGLHFYDMVNQEEYKINMTKV